MRRKVHGFDEEGAGRIARVVRAAEAAGADHRLPRRNTRTPGGRPKAWWRIVTNAGSGEYTVRKQEWDPVGGQLQDVSDATDPDYGVDRTAYHHVGVGYIAVGQKVPGWRIYAGGEWVLLIGSPDEGTASDPAIAYEGTFENETASALTWSRSSPPEGKDGVQLMSQTRTAYDHAGDEKLYGFYQILTFDSMGLLKAASAETRVEIDAPDVCT